MAQKINITIEKPEFDLGQTVYVPQKNKPQETTIHNYIAYIEKSGKGFFGAVSRYLLTHAVLIRRGDDSSLTPIVWAIDFYDNKEKAEKASEFLEVKLDDDSWRVAIGDRSVNDENSPYHLEKCNLPPCCADVSNVRDILLYCKKNGGLIVHERNELYMLTGNHGLEYDKQSPLGRIFEQLKVGDTFDFYLS